MFRWKYWKIYTKILEELIKLENKLLKTISYRLQFTDSTRFMAISLSDLVIGFAEGIHKITCKYGQDDKKSQTCGIKCKDAKLSWIHKR